MSVVDVPGVDVGSPAVLRVELVVKVDPASVTTNSEGPTGSSLEQRKRPQITLSRKQQLRFKLLSDHGGPADSEGGKNESKADDRCLEIYRKSKVIESALLIYLVNFQG